MEKRRFTFITPPTSRPQDDVFFPMGPLVLGSLLKEKGFEVNLLDLDILNRQNPQWSQNSNQYWDFFHNKVNSLEAEYFGISSICSNFPHAIQIAKVLKSKFPNSKILLGGPQPSAVAKKTLMAFDFIDAIVVGEGEITLQELMDSNWSREELQRIRGLCFRWKDQVIQNPPRELIEDLDTLPLPDLSLVDFPAYYEITAHIAVVEAGRGCPWRCNFCSTAEFWSRKYRAKSPKRILDEMRHIHESYGMTYFALTHDNFTTSPKYIAEFCDYFIQHNPGLTWASSARTDTLKKRDLAKLYDSGCRVLFFGVDSGSSRTQKSIEKYLNLEGYREILSETIRQGIKPTASFVIGFPEEHPEDLNATIELGLWSMQAGAKDVQFHRLSPLASTKVHRENIADLYLDPIATDISFLIQPDNEIINWILKYPDLFSSFYSVPAPHLNEIQLFDFSSFYNVIGNRFGPMLPKFMKHQKSSPLEMYQEWKRFAGKNYPPTSFEKGTRTREYYIDTFSDFI